MFQQRPIKILAVASGKGGVGKTNISVNISVAMAAAGREVVLLDADMGLANVDVLLGLQPRVNLQHVLDGMHTLEETILEGPAGLSIIPASSGVSRMANLGPADYQRMMQAFSHLSIAFDILVIDAAAGVSENVISFLAGAHEVMIVVCDEPASITDAYALIKVLSRERDIFRFHVISNMVQSMNEGRILYRKLDLVCQRFLGVRLNYMGTVPFDPYLRKSVQRQDAVVQAFPGSPSARAFRNLADVASRWPMPRGEQGHLGHFIKRLSGNSKGYGEYLI
jgi:flagellar biosynthesis protein FlhG